MTAHISCVTGDRKSTRLNSSHMSISYAVSCLKKKLEKVSHIWLLFRFHAVKQDQNKPPRLRVRPPRLGGNVKVGVFATRSTHRPNGIGMSVVKLEKIEGTKLYVSGVDLLFGAPTSANIYTLSLHDALPI